MVSGEASGHGDGGRFLFNGMVTGKRKSNRSRSVTCSDRQVTKVTFLVTKRGSFGRFFIKKRPLKSEVTEVTEVTGEITEFFLCCWMDFKPCFRDRIPSNFAL